MSFHASQTFTFGEQPSATKWQYIWDNDYALADGTGITSGVIVARHFGAGSVGSPALATGVPVQVVSTNYSAVASGSTIMPYDDTIPQNTEGDQYMTQAITPKSATNRLVVETTAFFSTSAAAIHNCAAIFQDTTANALAATAAYLNVATEVQVIKLVHDMLAGTTSSTTFKLRSGPQTTSTTTFNGVSAARRFGGITISNIKVTEYKG